MSDVQSHREVVRCNSLRVTHSSRISTWESMYSWASLHCNMDPYPFTSERGFSATLSKWVRHVIWIAVLFAASVFAILSWLYSRGKLVLFEQLRFQRHDDLCRSMSFRDRDWLGSRWLRRFVIETGVQVMYCIPGLHTPLHFFHDKHSLYDSLLLHHGWEPYDLCVPLFSISTYCGIIRNSNCVACEMIAPVRKLYVRSRGAPCKRAWKNSLIRRWCNLSIEYSSSA